MSPLGPYLLPEPHLRKPLWTGHPRASLGSLLLVPPPALLLSHRRALQPQMPSPGERVSHFGSAPRLLLRALLPGAGKGGHAIGTGTLRPSSAPPPSRGRWQEWKGPRDHSLHVMPWASANKTPMDRRRVCEVSYL